MSILRYFVNCCKNATLGCVYHSYIWPENYYWICLLLILDLDKQLEMLCKHRYSVIPYHCLYFVFCTA